VGIKICAQQTIISRRKRKKKGRTKGRIMRYGHHDSGSGASSIVKYLQKKKGAILFLEPILENFDYSLGGYSHRER
jgi:hypothetical protein